MILPKNYIRNFVYDITLLNRATVRNSEVITD